MTSRGDLRQGRSLRVNRIESFKEDLQVDFRPAVEGGDTRADGVEVEDVESFEERLREKRVRVVDVRHFETLDFLAHRSWSTILPDD